MDDGIAFEARGIPAATIVTTAFLPEARAKAEVLGLPEFTPVVIAHPLAAISVPELYERVEAAIPQIVAVLTGETKAS